LPVRDEAADNDGVAAGDVRALKRVRRGGEDKFLGSLEAQVMDRIWSRGSATVRDVVVDLAKTKQLAYTTVMTIMTRLHEKGLLRRSRDGKTYVYRPAFSREQFRARLSRDIVRGLVAEFGDVALAQFVAALDEVDERHRRALERVAKAEET
jgi:predicted transcriptional regulator